MNANEPEPAPSPVDGTPIWELVVRDMQEHDKMGEKKYGHRLRAGNGRDALVDAYQEALDLAVYLRQKIEEDSIELVRLHECFAAMKQAGNGLSFAQEQQILRALLGAS